MTKDQIEQKIAELHEKAFTLQKEIEEVEREAVKMKDVEEWPKENDKFYYIEDNGRVFPTNFINNKDGKDTISIGNCFRTEADAEFAVERLKVLAEMRKFAFEPDWNNVNQSKWVIVCDHGIIKMREYHTCNHGLICFEGKRIAESCIKVIGDERLKKYYFGVKDDK